MGYYIQGPAKGKASFLVKEYGAMELPFIPSSLSDILDDKAVICVVDNGPFEAAAFCFDDIEVNDFKLTKSDTRPRKWLIMDLDKAKELSGFTANERNS